MVRVRPLNKDEKDRRQFQCVFPLDRQVCKSILVKSDFKCPDIQGLHISLLVNNPLITSGQKIRDFECLAYLISGSGKIRE